MNFDHGLMILTDLINPWKMLLGKNRMLIDDVFCYNIYIIIYIHIWIVLASIDI